ncbi:DNA repair protein RecN [Faecalimonas sp.]
MLQNLHIKNLALIDEIEVDFEKGLNILTGETGAGKSIILGSIHLALGGKYNADMLRKGASYGLVELTFRIEKEEIKKALEKLDIFPEENEVVFSRKLMEGRSVSRINGETVSINKVKEAASILIDIHGQHEHQSLLYKKNHLDILDAFAKEQISEMKTQVKEKYTIYKKIKEELKQAKIDETDREKEIDFIQFEVNQIREANFKFGEDKDLEEQYKKMINSKRIVENLEEVSGYMGEYGGNGIGDMLNRAIRCIGEISHMDHSISALHGQLSDVDNLLNDFNRELSEYRHTLEFSEEEFYETETRLNEINRLKAKYGQTIEEILSYCEEKEERLEKLNDYDAYVEQLQKKYCVAEENLKEVTKQLSEGRKKAAILLKDVIKEGLLELNFLEVQFEISFNQLEEFTANGKDEIEFLISMNPGELVKPLGEVASGGELSRIMLAIKTVLADKDAIETLIFDEIDVGISGRTAQKVSEKMCVIGRKHQVICITHLAQIAAMADAHFAIEKKVNDGKTKTEISKLNEEQSIQELARILGGAQITDKVIENAIEMKNLALNVK